MLEVDFRFTNGSSEDDEDRDKIGIPVVMNLFVAKTKNETSSSRTRYDLQHDRDSEVSNL